MRELTQTCKLRKSRSRCCAVATTMEVLSVAQPTTKTTVQKTKQKLYTFYTIAKVFRAAAVCNDDGLEECTMCWKMSNVQSCPEVIATTTATTTAKTALTTKRATKVKQNIKDSRRAGALTLNAFHFSRQFLHFSHLRCSFEFLLADEYSVNKLVLFRKFFS